MYGYAPFNPAVAPSPAYPMTYGGPYYTVIGQETTEKTLGQRTSEFLESEPLGHGIKNKYVMAAALGGGLLYYGWHAGWFG